MALCKFGVVRIPAGPRLRNDLQACAIQLLKCDDDEASQQALLQQVTPNDILLPVEQCVRHVRKTHLAGAFRKAVHADCAETQLYR